ncbi:MAG: hypothetical protein ABI625_07880 [bacterium]
MSSSVTHAPLSHPTVSVRRLPEQLAEQMSAALTSFLLATLFCGWLWAAYRLMIPRIFDSFGAGLLNISLADTAVNWALALAPSVLLPRKFKGPTDLLVLAQYYFIYAPACILLSHVSLPHLSAQDVRGLQLAILSGMLVLLAMRHLPPLRLRRPRLRPSTFVILFGAFSFAMFAYLTLILGRNFRLTDLKQIYDVRANAWRQAGQTFAPGILYALIWADSVVVPLLFAIAAQRRRWLSAVILIGGNLFLLGIGGAKTSIVAIVVLPALFIAARPQSTRLATGLPVMLMAVFVMAFLLGVFAPPIITVGFLAVAVLRVFCVPTILLAQYLNFFSNHPLTHFSHVAIINRVVPYPYTGDLATMIGMYFYRVPVGSNAGMWAADGISSLGLVGIPVVSVIAGLIFWLAESIAADLDPRLATTALGFIALSFTNISLATTLLTGGLLVVLGWGFLAPSTGRAHKSFLPAAAS